MPKYVYVVRGAMVREEDKNDWSNWRPYFNEVERESDVSPLIVAQEEFERLLDDYHKGKTNMIPICFCEYWSAEEKFDRAL